MSASLVERIEAPCAVSPESQIPACMKSTLGCGLLGNAADFPHVSKGDIAARMSREQES